MKYITNYQIIDTEDGNRYYKKGAEFPAKNAKVSDERIKILLEKKHIYEDKSLKDYTVKELKEMAQEKELEGYSDLKKDELIELLEKE